VGRANSPMITVCSFVATSGQKPWPSAGQFRSRQRAVSWPPTLPARASPPREIRTGIDDIGPGPLRRTRHPARSLRPRRSRRSAALRRPRRCASTLRSVLSGMSSRNLGPRIERVVANAAGRLRQSLGFTNQNRGRSAHGRADAEAPRSSRGSQVGGPSATSAPCDTRSYAAARAPADFGRSVARHRRSTAPRRLHPTSGHMPRRAPADFGRGVARHRRSRPSRSVTASSAVANSEVGDRRTQRT